MAAAGGSMISMVFGCLIAVAAVLQCAGAQSTTHVVGDNLGWTIPAGSNVYPSWASSKTFRVGDTLVFNFTNGAHTVAEVTKAAYDACTVANPIGSVLTISPARIPLNSQGTHYYICTVGTHCLSFQKLAINVSAAGTPTATPPTTPTASPPSPTPTSSPPSTTPSPPSTTASPPPGNTLTPPSAEQPPATRGPSSSTTPPPPPPPSSAPTSLAVAGFSVTLLSVAVAFLL